MKEYDDVIQGQTISSSAVTDKPKVTYQEYKMYLSFVLN